MPAVRDAVNEPVVAQWTPLQVAASDGRAEVIKALLSTPGIDVNARKKAKILLTFGRKRPINFQQLDLETTPITLLDFQRTGQAGHP